MRAVPVHDTESAAPQASARVLPAEPPPPDSDTRFHRIQALRFVAALGVLVYHASTLLQLRGTDGGAFVRFFDFHFSWGVNLFFVISGFVIAHAIERTPVGQFALHRFLRIYPAYWLAIAVVLLARWLCLGNVTGTNDLALAVTLLPFGPIDFPLQVEWTLLYEVFFYAVVCAVASFGWQRSRDSLLIAWPIVIVVAFVLRSTPAQPPSLVPTLDRIVFSPYNFLFIAGMLVHRVHLRVPVRLRHYFLLAAPFLILGVDLMSTRAVPKLFVHAAGFGALVLWAVLADRAHRLSPRNVLVKLGDWSYGLYLVHLPAIGILLAAGFGASLPPGATFVLLTIAALLIGSAFGALELRLYRRLLRAVNVRRGVVASGAAIDADAALAKRSDRADRVSSS